MISKSEQPPETMPPHVDMYPQVDGQLLDDMFLTMAYNLREFKDGASRNSDLKDRLGALMPDGDLFRDWKLRLKVRSHVAGSLIMRHGANVYLEEVEDGLQTVGGIVTSMNCDVASFSVDPVDGVPDKDREVTVMPVDLRTLQKHVSIEVLSIG